MNRNDEHLIKACLKGKREAQLSLYEQYKTVMFALCLRYGKNREDAEDILQNGFIKVFRDLGQYKPIAPLGAWIRKVMVNTALEHVRKNKKHSLSENEEDGRIQYNPKTDNSSSELHAKELTLIIQSIPQEYSVVFNMFAIEGYSHKEIAEALQISESNSKVRLNRARTMLQEKIEKHFETS